MLKKLAYTTLVLVITGCASQPQPVYTQQVYIEQQVIIPNKMYQCQQYIDQERQCWTMRYRDTRAMCIEESRNRYQNCMIR
jgi:hypothetical protein